MRKLAISFVLSLSVCASVLAASYQSRFVDIAGPTNAAWAVTGTLSTVSGPIVALHVILGTATNVDVDIVVDPEGSLEDNFVLYSADDVDADAIIRPVFPQHTSAGAATTNNMQPYICNDPVKVIISDWAVTSRTARVKIVWERR